MTTFSNQATLSYADTETNSNPVVGELLDVLTVTKTALTQSYARTGHVTFIISVVNTSQSAFGALTVKDTLGAYPFGNDSLAPLSLIENSVRLYINGILQPMPTVSAGPPLVISDLAVPAGGNILILYDTAITPFAPLDASSSITNTVRLCGCGISSPLTASETVYVSSGANLTISKSLFPSTVTENGQLTYTFAVQNTGNVAATPLDNLIITDVFDPILSAITVTYNGVIWSSPTHYTYDTLTGRFVTADGQISVPAATFTQDSLTGKFILTPGVSIIQVTGTVSV